MTYFMNVCEKCGEPASRSITWDEDKGVTRINYYCKNLKIIFQNLKILNSNGSKIKPKTVRVSIDSDTIVSYLGRFDCHYRFTFCNHSVLLIKIQKTIIF